MEIPFTDTGNKAEELPMRRKGSSVVGEEVWNCLWNVQVESSTYSESCAPAGEDMKMRNNQDSTH